MSLIDKAQIQSISGGEPQLLLPILQEFAESAETLITEALAAAQSTHLPDLRGRLHQLKGASGTLGLSTFYEACLLAEQHCNSGTTPDLSQFKTLINDSLAQATTFITAPEVQKP